MKIYVFTFFACILALSSSCVEDLDLDQLDDVVLTPVYDFDFIYSGIDLSSIPNVLPPNTDFTPDPLVDIVNYDFVGTQFAVDNLERVELTIEISNTIERGFTFQFQFLTEDEQPLLNPYVINVQPGLGVGTEPVVSPSADDPNFPIVLDNADLNQLVNAKKIRTEIIFPTLNTDLRGVLELKSKAKYYVNYEL